MICTLVAIAWAHTYMQGFHKVCYYDCGSKKHGYYDRAYRVHPDSFCPTRLELA